MLAGIHRYPVKSTAGETLSSATVGEEGLLQDRCFMVVKPDGSFMTARKYPGLQRVCARFDGEPLRALARYHRGKEDRNNIYFGQNLVAENAGTLDLGNKIEVLE